MCLKYGSKDKGAGIMRKPTNVKKLLLLNIPYIIAALFATNFGEAWRLATGVNASEKLIS